MRADLAILAFLLAVHASGATAQSPTQPQRAPRDPGAQTRAVVPPPVIACASLANLRAVLRSTGDDAAAAVPIVTDPKSDLGCTVLDRGTVTGIADQVALNGRAYECVAQQGTSVCHWTVAGSVSAPRDKPRR